MTFAPPTILTPTTLLLEANETPVHLCEEILAEETGTRPDLTDRSWRGAVAWFTDGSSFMVEGWAEAFPTKRETANVVAKKILEEILPHFGIPKPG